MARANREFRPPRQLTQFAHPNPDQFSVHTRLANRVTHRPTRRRDRRNPRPLTHCDYASLPVTKSHGVMIFRGLSLERPFSLTRALKTLLSMSFVNLSRA